MHVSGGIILGSECSKMHHKAFGGPALPTPAVGAYSTLPDAAD